MLRQTKKDQIQDDRDDDELLWGLLTLIGLGVIAVVTWLLVYHLPFPSPFLGIPNHVGKMPPTHSSSTSPSRPSVAPGAPISSSVGNGIGSTSAPVSGHPTSTSAPVAHPITNAPRSTSAPVAHPTTNAPRTTSAPTTPIATPSVPVVRPTPPVQLPTVGVSAGPSGIGVSVGQLPLPVHISVSIPPLLPSLLPPINVKLG